MLYSIYHLGKKARWKVFNPNQPLLPRREKYALGTWPSLKDSVWRQPLRFPPMNMMKIGQ